MGYLGDGSLMHFKKTLSLSISELRKKVVLHHLGLVALVKMSANVTLPRLILSKISKKCQPKQNHLMPCIYDQHRLRVTAIACIRKSSIFDF